MSYLVIARKFRPQTFAAIAGQEHITKALANAILRDRMPHALLLTGPRGVGKTTAARVVARALNCTGRELNTEPGESGAESARDAVEPCGECANCKEIAASASMSVWEVDGASNNSVDNVRELIDSLRSLPPPGSKYKIYIIDEVHMLSTAAFNALLKSLEEPPPNTVFIFATTEPHKIPETVISRCQRHDFRRLPATVIATRLAEIAEAEKVQLDEPVLNFIARKAQGGMRDAQSMLDRLLSFSGGRVDLELAQQIFGVVDHSFFLNLSDAIFTQDPERCFKLLDDAFVQSLDIRHFVADFIAYWRQALLLGTAIEGAATKGVKTDDERLQALLQLSEGEYVDLKSRLADVTAFDLQRLFDIAESTVRSALTSTYPRFVIEAGVSKMATLPSMRDLPSILSDISKQLSGSGFAQPVSGSVSSAKRPVVESMPAPQAGAPQEDKINKQQEAPRASAATDMPQRTDGGSSFSESSADFNPSWQDFVHHVKSRSEVMLAAFLRRVSANKFATGLLELQGSEFDLKSLEESTSLSSLRDCLHSYSGFSNWKIDFKPTEEHVEDSVASMEIKAEKQRKSKIVKDSKEDPLVKAALETFEGSKIETVSVLK
ncbi:hypothetical protein BVY02_02240 [bacterium J17]|nr:hypothetical protein BVY02_02240 [bacterium J17]